MTAVDAGSGADAAPAAMAGAVRALGPSVRCSLPPRGPTVDLRRSARQDLSDGAHMVYA
jgi:hypothetical protein